MASFTLMRGIVAGMSDQELLFARHAHRNLGKKRVVEEWRRDPFGMNGQIEI